MTSDIDLLSEIRIASPCTASWDEMQGDDRVRFCQHCRLNVYNLSAVTRREAESLVKEKEGRLCVRLYRRRDGTALTADCPVGLRALRRALIARAGFITTAYAAVSCLSRRRPTSCRCCRDFSRPESSSVEKGPEPPTKN